MGRAGLINSGGALGRGRPRPRPCSTAVINKRAGGMGLISGRKAFQRPMKEGVELLNAIQDVYLDKQRHRGVKRMGTELRRPLIPTRSVSEDSAGNPLAGASGSTSQTTTIVTPSPHAIVSTQVLLELARWCQQRLANTEEHHRCHRRGLHRTVPPRPRRSRRFARRFLAGTS